MTEKVFEIMENQRRVLVAGGFATARTGQQGLLIDDRRRRKRNSIVTATGTDAVTRHHNHRPITMSGVWWARMADARSSSASNTPK